jgi:hypothetical protein
MQCLLVTLLWSNVQQLAWSARPAITLQPRRPFADHKTINKYIEAIGAANLPRLNRDMHTAAALCNTTVLSKQPPRLAMRTLWLSVCFAIIASITTANAFECGAPLAPCGEAIPAGTKCPKGAGWCTAGHYCGYPEDSSKAQCVPLPKNRGKAGYECCPSNAATPHTSSTDPLKRIPFCKDGSTCKYDFLQQTTSMTPDPYAGVKGEIFLLRLSQQQQQQQQQFSVVLRLSGQQQ